MELEHQDLIVMQPCGTTAITETAILALFDGAPDGDPSTAKRLVEGFHVESSEFTTVSGETPERHRPAAVRMGMDPASNHAWDRIFKLANYRRDCTPVQQGTATGSEWRVSALCRR